MKSNYRTFAGPFIAALVAFTLSSCAGYTRVVVVDKSDAKQIGPVAVADQHYVNGIKLYKKGKYKPAIKQFELSINLHPKNWKSHYYLGMALREKKAYRKSTRQFEKALQLAPRDNEIQSDIYVDLGIAWERYGVLDRAADSFANALELDSKNFDAKAGLKRSHKKNHKTKNKGHRG